MRVHLAEISASKKAAKAKAKAKAEIKMDCEVDDEEDNCYQLRGSTKTQSNSAFRDEEQIKNRDSNTDSEDADQNSSYELRENPKKSWRFSDPRRGLTISKDGASCKDCGKKFSTLRALSGHMRTHSIRNKKETHPCKECGKAFDSMRAMFGHMKSHPKRSRVADDSTDSLSDLDNLCPVRKKRSTIRYKSAPSPSLSNLNESNSNVDLGDVKEVAKILIMLSRGVRNWSKFDLVIESPDDDDFVYVGADVSRRSNKIVGNDGDLVCDADNKINMSFSIGKFDSCHPSCANALEDSNVSEFVNKDAIKVGFGVADDEKLLSVENETKVDLEVTDDRVGVDEHEPLDEFAVKQDCANEKGFLGYE